MMILTLRTDKPEAEIGLYDGTKQLAYEKWEAHRELSSTIHKKIDALIKEHQKAWQEIEGIVCFKGPGSFTGLRIGLTVANVLASTLAIPIVATNQDDWQEKGIQLLLGGKDEKIVLPEYGRDAHITKPKK